MSPPRGRQPGDAPAKRKRSETDATPPSKRPRLGLSLSLTSEDDAKALGAVEGRYDVQLHSVLSSSKMQKKVSAVLRNLSLPPRSEEEHATSTSTSTTATAATGCGNTSAAMTTKIRIAVLRAKASDAGKLVSIAEIAKREIEKEGKETAKNGGDRPGGSGRWFQYIALGEEKKERPRDAGKSVIEETMLEGARDKGKEDPDARDGDEDEDEDDFEVMKTPFERAIEGQPLVRGVPVMSLFLSRDSVEELRKRYGEQTNVRPPIQNSKRESKQERAQK